MINRYVAHVNSINIIEDGSAPRVFRWVNRCNESLCFAHEEVLVSEIWGDEDYDMDENYMSEACYVSERHLRSPYHVWLSGCLRLTLASCGANANTPKPS